MLDHINNTPHLVSYLWDVGLMPEQLEKESAQWWFMMGIAWRDKHQEVITDIECHI